jgi:hypothetical protein
MNGGNEGRRWSSLPLPGGWSNGAGRFPKPGVNAAPARTNQTQPAQQNPPRQRPGGDSRAKAGHGVRIARYEEFVQPKGLWVTVELRFLVSPLESREMHKNQKSPFGPTVFLQLINLIH